MAILTLLKTVVALAAAVFDWMRQRQTRALVDKADEAISLEETTDAIDRAHRARIGIERDAGQHPDGLRADDSYRRD